MKRLMGIRQAAEILGVSDEQVRKLCARGAFSPIRIGYRVMIPVEQVEKISRTGWRYSPAYETRGQLQQAAAL